MIGTIHKSVVDGNKYNFEIVSENGKRDVCFYIRAICKSTQRTSCINNLNAVLSEFGIEEVKPKYEDSSWVVLKKEAKRFMRTSQEFLSDKLYMKYLENKLDEDRERGEWENIHV